MNVTLRTLPRMLGTQKRNYFVAVVNQSHEAYRETFGAHPQKVSTGLTFGIPFIHTLRTVDMRESTIPIEGLGAYTKDNVPVSTSFSLFYKVTDSYKACYGVQNYVGSLANLGTSTVRTVIGQFTYDQIISERNSLTTRLVNDIGSSIDNWGCICTRAELQDFRPQNREVQKQLELQMEAERERRKNELISQALVNTAEANKTARILESESQLVANTNLAQGQFLLAQKEADGKRYAMEAYTQAMINQLQAIIKETDNVELSTKIFLENMRLTNMGLIASGPNNKIYFVPTEQGGIIPTAQTISEMIKS